MNEMESKESEFLFETEDDRQNIDKSLSRANKWHRTHISHKTLKKIVEIQK